MGVEKALYGLKYAIRWHPGTSLASGHVVGIRARRWHPGTSLASGHVVGIKRILHKRQKKRLFSKKTGKKFCYLRNLSYLCTV